MSAVGTTHLDPSQVITAASPADDRGERARPFDWRLTLRVAKCMAHYPALFWTIMGLAVLLALLNGSIPLVIAETIRGAIEIAPDTLRERLGLSTTAWLWMGVAMVVVLALTWNFTMRLRQYAVNDLSERVVRDLRRRLFAHLMVLGMDFYDRTKVGRILARGTSDVDALRSAVSQVAPRVTISIVQMTYALAIMLTYDLVLGLTVVAGAPVIYFLNWRFRLGLSSAYRLVQETFSLLTANLAESIAGIRVTQAFAREERNREMFHRLCELHGRRHLTVARWQGVYRPLMDITSQIFIAIALLVGGWRIAEGHMSVGDLLGFMLMTGVFFQPILVIGDMYNVTLQAMAGAERVFQLLDTPPAKLDPDPAEAIALPRHGAWASSPCEAEDEQCSIRHEGSVSSHGLEAHAPVIVPGMRVEFEGVTFGYLKSRPVLHDISFIAEPGRTIALVGHTGSGKTSIVNLVAKFYLPDVGRITIDGIDLRRIRPIDLHAQMGIVQQENFLFTGTVMDNIRFARPEASDEEVRDICERLGCLDILERLPDGLHTEVGERGATLSLGQRQLACFARAMLADPRLLILDEATSAVDTVSEHRVQMALSRLLQGRTSFVIAHRLSTIRHADLILVIHQGRLAEQGTHEELLQRGRVYPALHAEFVRLAGEEQ